MNTLFYPAFDSLEIRTLPVPSPQPWEVLLRVAACGLCGSELETFKNHSPRRQPPLVMGHEFCGTVEAVGREVDSAFIGRRFVSNSVVPCGRCACCRRGNTHLCRDREIFGMHRNGAFAEYVAVPQEILIPWPDDITATQACLTEPLANGIHVVNLTRHLQIEKALVIGAGSIGLMCQQTLKVLRNIHVMVCDLSSGRLETAVRLGAEKVVCSGIGDVTSEVLDWTAGEGIDLVVDAAGSAATKRLSLAALRPGGAAVWIGLHDNATQLDTYDVTLQEKQVLGSYSAKNEELAHSLDLIRNKQVDVSSWVDIEPLQNSVEGFRRMLRPADGDIKAVFVP